MPPQKKTSDLFSKYGSKFDKALQSHANDETTYGIVRLPGGISNGIAQLIGCKFGTYQSGNNKGEPFFQARGTVVSPAEVATKDGVVPVRGLQTMIQIPICNTKNADGVETTQEEHIADVLNEFRKLGCDTSQIKSGPDLEALAAALQQLGEQNQGPYFRFSTSYGKVSDKYPEPRVWENWHGIKGLEEYSPEDVSEQAVQEEVREKVSSPKPPPNHPAKTPVPSKTQAGGRGKPPVPPKKQEKQFDEFGDLNSLAEKADVGDEEAIDELTTQALKVGVEQDDIDNASSWADVVALMTAPSEEETEEEIGEESEEEGGEESAEEEEAETEWEPKLGEVYFYTPVDPKTKKAAVNPRTKKPLKVTCEIKAVNTQKKTVDLKNLDDGKTLYKTISWEDLMGE